MHNHSHNTNSRILALDACTRGGSAGNPRTVTPLQNAHYSVTVLDAQVRPAIKRYHVEVVSMQAELAVELAPGDFCGNGPITLRVEGALPHYTYRWSTGETTSEIQVPLSGMAAAYRVTVADARQDGAGVWKTCEQALEIRTAEALAAVEAQKCELLFSRLEALGFEAREVKIVEPAQAIAPRSLASATCNVVDHTDFRVEWYEETRTPASILCSELAEMEGVTQGFIYASDDICTEADLAEVEALINDETLLHVYLKPCGGEEYGVLMEKGAQDPTDIAAIGEAYNYYFDYNGSMLLKEAIPLPMLPGKVFVRKNDIDKCPWPSLCSNMPLVTRYDEVQSLLFQIFFIFSETLKLTMPIFGKEQVLITIYLNLTIFEQKLMKKP
jgi:hypothetical protein